MLEGLKKKWNVNGWRLFIILIIFALAGKSADHFTRLILKALSVHTPTLYVFLYVVTVTILWPLAILVISLPLGQYTFFLNYLKKLVRRLSGRKKIIIFASGAGSNAQKIIDHFRGTKVSVGQIAGNRADAGIVSIARREGIPFLLLEKERFFRGDAYLPELDTSADLVVLAGFLWKVPPALTAAFPGRVINIHPALLPKFGGKGMYGGHVHTAVLEAGELQSGITIHHVDEHYDNGAIIFQTACPVLPGDTPETLAGRIHTLEHLHYPRVIDELLNK